MVSEPTVEKSAAERAAFADRLDAEAKRMRMVGNPGRADELTEAAARARSEPPKARRAAIQQQAVAGRPRDTA